MKKNVLLIFAGVLVSTTTFASTMVEEVSYNQLVNELRIKKAQSPREKAWSPTGYAIGMELVQSSSTYELSGNSARPALTGFEVNASTNVYDQWFGVAEGRLFSSAESGGIRAGARELNGKVLYVTDITNEWLMQAGPGIGFRMSDVSDSRGRSADPMALGLILEGGAGYKINETITATASVGARSPIAGGNDKGSFDIALGIGTKL